MKAAVTGGLIVFVLALVQLWIGLVSTQNIMPFWQTLAISAVMALYAIAFAIKERE